MFAHCIQCAFPSIADQRDATLRASVRVDLRGRDTAKALGESRHVIDDEGNAAGPVIPLLAMFGFDGIVEFAERPGVGIDAKLPA
jgi:hypothetical protein